MDVASVIQGCTEFLPVSSSLHLELWATWCHLPWSKDHEVSLHLGTLIALCAYFLPPRKWPSFKTAVYVVVATLPAVFVGFYIKRSGIVPPHAWLLYSTLLGGVCLLAAEKIALKRRAQPIHIGHALLIGVAQVLAFIPGASRMGTTITMARLLGVSVKEALTFSWLLAIPTVGGAVTLTLWDAWKSGQPIPLQTNQIVVTSLVGWCAMVLVSRYAGSRLLQGCAYYRIILGLILLFWFGTLSTPF